MKALASLFCAFAVFCSAYSNAKVDSPSALSSQTMHDIPYRAALYQYNSGNYLKGLMGLSFAQRNEDIRVHREVLAGKLNLELKRYQAAQASFDALEGNQVPANLSRTVAFSLAELNYVKGNCTKVLESLESIKDLPIELDYNARFMRVSCLVLQPESNALAQAEKTLLKALSGRKGPHEADIWFSYAYYNLAIAAGKKSLHSEADRYYIEALKYTGYTDEGLELINRIRLSHAYANYASNRFDFAMKTFAELPLDGLWLDKSLLGYGWAAFRNYQPGIALESWRQLVNLPFKSMSVYEGYIAIPFALEKSHAFSESWVSYKFAIEEYTNVIAEIDNLEKTLTLKKIEAHAKEYAQRGDDELVEPLHPLLAYTYAQDDFRVLIERVGEVESYQKRLDFYVETLDILSESRGKEKNSKRMSNSELKRRQKSIDNSLSELGEALPPLADALLENEMKRPEVDVNLKAKYQEYLRLSQMLGSSSSDKKTKRNNAERLERLKGVLIGQLYQQNRDEFGHLANVTRLTSSYHQLSVRYESYKQMRKTNYKPVVKDEHLRSAHVKIAALKKQSDKILLSVQEELLKKTLSVLEEQKQRIVNYRHQARIAKTRLEEEFFQRGSREL